MNKPRAIIYTRVSSDQQIDNTSLDEQIRLGKKYCETKGIEFVHEFREMGESAKFADRTKLLEALNFCSKKSNYFLSSLQIR